MPVSANDNNRPISSSEPQPIAESGKSQDGSAGFRGRDVKSSEGKRNLPLRLRQQDASIQEKSIKPVKRARPLLQKNQVAGAVAGAAAAGGALGAAVTGPEESTSTSVTIDGVTDIKDTPDSTAPDSTVQPRLGGTEAEEYAIFKNLMAPYKDLPPDQQQKAVLVLMQDRLREHITYGYDSNTEGVAEYVASPAETLADNGQGIDCEDYAIMCERWCGYAKAEGLLPQESNSCVLIVDDLAIDSSAHAIFVYESDGSPSERYVIDTLSIADQNPATSAFDNDLDSSGDDLVSFDEYFANTDYHLVSQADVSYDPNNPGHWIFSQEVATDEWLSQASSSNTIGSTISHSELIARQEAWLEQGNELGLGDNFQDHVEELEYQIDLIEARQLLGKVGMGEVVNADYLGLSIEQREELVGQYSEHYRRPFTESDLGLQSRFETPWLDPSEMTEGLSAQSLNDAGQATAVPIDSLAADEGQSLPATNTEHLELLGFNPQLYTDAAQLGTEIAAGVVESTFVAAFAQKKLYKLKKRQQAIDSAHKISAKREKQLFDQLIGPGSSSLFSPDQRCLAIKSFLSREHRVLSAKKLNSRVAELFKQLDVPVGELSPKQLKAMGISKKEVIKGYYHIRIDSDKLYSYLKTSSQNFPDLFSLSKSKKMVTKEQFRQYADLCFINDGQQSAPLGNILKHRDCYVEHNNLSQLLEDVLRLNATSGRTDDLIPQMRSPLSRDDMHVLSNFSQALQSRSHQAMQDITAIKQANKVLDKLGIHIDFRRDKLFGSLRKDAKAIYQRVRINPDKLFPHMEKLRKLPRVKDIDQVLHRHSDNIDALHTLKNYDQWKIHQHKRDRDLKLASAITGFLPLSLGVDEVLKAVAYGREKKYRDKNRTAMNGRIDDTLAHLGGETDSSRKLKALVAVNGQPLSTESLITIGQSLTDLLQDDGGKKQQAVVKALTNLNDRLVPGEDLELDVKEYKKLQKQLDSAGINITGQKIEINSAKLSKVLHKKDLASVSEPINVNDNLKQFGWQQDELDQLATMLDNARKVKSSHMDIKSSKAALNTGIHAAAFAADPFSTVMGPVGRAIKAGAKAGAKAGVTVAAAIDRQRGDKKLRDQGTFSEPKEIYQFYKKLYQDAVQMQQMEKADSIQRLAEVTFGVPARGFDALVKTDLVENSRFKLSFSRD